MSPRYLLFVLLSAALLVRPAAVDAGVDSVSWYFNQGTKEAIARGALLLPPSRPADSATYLLTARTIRDHAAKSRFFSALGDKQYELDQYTEARHFYLLGLKEAKLSLDKNLIADALANVGDMYRLQDQYTLALPDLLRALELYRETGNKQKIAHVLGLIGDLNRCMKQYNDALKYLNEALLLAQKNGFHSDATFCYSSIGGTYHETKQYERGLDTYLKGRDLALYMKDTSRLVDLNHSIGDLLAEQKKLQDALKYFNEGTRLAKACGDLYNLAYCYLGRSRVYLALEQHQRALADANEAYRIVGGLESLGFLAEVSEVLSQIYAATGDYRKAYQHLHYYKTTVDSTIDNSQVKQQAMIELTFQNSIREKQDSMQRYSEQKQRDLLHQAELDQQKLLASGGAIGVGVAVIIAFIMFRSYRREKASSRIISQQKLLVDMRSKEILDSINYAQKIQKAIIPTVAELEKTFPQSFVLLMPKDIVSGDFYWVGTTEQYDFFVVADCTGHGVPGGFMSMLGTALLNEIINEKKIHEPEEILDMLRLKIILSLRQSENLNENKDGMDLALIRLSRDRRILCFAGANNSMLLVRDGKMQEFKGDKHPIGFVPGRPHTQFSQRFSDLEPGDMLYMFTDGYPDQFGGPQGKKFKYRQLEQLLTQVSKEPMSRQRATLKKALEDWKGSLEQVDDILVAGIRI